MRAKRQQSGFALLIFLMILIGMGAFVVEGYMQNIAREVEASKYSKNRQILEVAKQSLLMFAYNYAEYNSTGVGPGRLPCPDDDNDGLIGSSPSLLQCNAVGRLPWKDSRLSFHQAKDASGEVLWYAVSDQFHNVGSGSDVINSDSKGTITLVDQSGAIIYDGSVAGIAAVIIAPGAAINRDENNDGTYEYAQVRSTATQKNNPKNYLDTFNGFDNSAFVNLSAATADGFILGPVKDQNSVVVNDQIIVVTADEVIAMAEKAVLEYYGKAITEYRANTGGVYPLLFNYATASLESFNSGLTNIGRIPSIFSKYFTNADSEPIDSKLLISVTKTFLLPGSLPLSTHNLTLLKESINTLSNLRFDNSSRLRAFAVAEKLEQNMYFWDDLASPTGIWRRCNSGADQLVDCNRDASGNPDPGSPSNQRDSKILKVSVEIDLSTSIDFDLDYSAPIMTQYLAADPSTHAWIIRTFSASKVSEPSFVFSVEEAEYDTSMVYNDTSFDDQEVNDDNDIGPLISLSTSDIKIGMRYYPELPEWAKTSENNWHRSILMAISPNYMPGATAPCTPPNCLSVVDMGGVNNNKVALLLMAGSSAINDNGTPNNYSDDLDDIFDTGNFDLDRNFFRRNGDDTILILQEQ